MPDALTNLDLIQLGAAAADGEVRRAPLDQEITELFQQWRPPLLKYLSTFGLTTHDAEEIVQEVFLSLFSHLKRNKSRANLRGWLFRVAHNQGLKRRYSKKSTTAMGAELGNLPHPAPNPEQQFADTQRHRCFASILDALPEEDRRCLYLRAEGLRYREIAEILGMSLGFVAASLERSLARFERADQR